MAVVPLPIPIPQAELAEFCEKNGVARLALFGSVLTDHFRPESDVDILVEFRPGESPSLLGMARVERQLSELLGRKVDLRTKAELSRYFRDDVVRRAVVQYERS